jgi:hypothetical protein
MRIVAAGIIHCLLEGFAIGFVKHAMGSSQHLGTLPLRACSEAVDVTGYFDLLA